MRAPHAAPPPLRQQKGTFGGGTSREAAGRWLVPPPTSLGSDGAGHQQRYWYAWEERGQLASQRTLLRLGASPGDALVLVRQGHPQHDGQSRAPSQDAGHEHGCKEEWGGQVRILNQLWVGPVGSLCWR